MKYFKEFSDMTKYDNEKDSLSIPNLCYIIEDDVVIYSTKSISDAVISCDDSTYDGEYHIATNIVVKVGSTTLVNNVDYQISDNNGGTSAGNYYFTITGINNYCGKIIGKYSINKVTPIVSAPTPKVLTYNGQAQELIVAGSTNYGTLKYSMDDATWSTNVPKATDVGNYTVWYRVEGNSNVNDISENSVVCSINKSQTSYTVILSKYTYIYSGNACEPTVTVKNGDVVIPSTQYSVAYNNNVNAGTATVIVRDNSGAIIGSVTFTIEKASGSVSTTPTNITGLTYNGTAQILVNPGVGTGTILYKVGSSSWGGYMPSVSDAGNYTVYYKASASTNYNESASGSVSCSIAKVTPTVTAPTTNILVFNGSSQILANAGSANYGTIQYCLNNSGGTYSTTVPSATNAGAYNVWYKVIGNSNINDVAPTNVPVSILEKYISSPKIELDPSGYTYNGSACVPTVVVKDGTTVIPSSEYTIIYQNNTNAGNASVNINDKTGGNYDVNGETGFTISRANGSVSTAPTAKSLTYNGNSQALVNAGSSSTGAMVYKLGNGSWTEIIPTASNVGTYTVYYKAAESTNYNESASGSVSCTISKANPSYVAPTAKSTLIYDSTEKELLNLGSTNDGLMEYSSDGTTWSTISPKGTNAGTYSVYWRITGDSNHNNKPSTAISVTIAKAAGSVSTKPTANSLIYNGSSQALINAGSGTGTMLYKEGSNEWGTDIPIVTNAGSYTVYYKASATTNYSESTSGSVSVNMAKVTPTVTAPIARSLTYNGSAQALVSGGSTDWGVLKYSLDNSTYSTSIPSGTNAGDYSVYYKVDGDNNINGVAAQSISVNILKVAGSVTTTPTAKSLYYNGVAQNLVNEGSGTGTMLYKEGENAWSTSIPNATTAGTYVVYYKASASTNYNESESGSVACSIEKVTPTVTAPATKSITYNGSAQALVNAGSTNYGTLQYSLDDSTYGTSIPSGTNAGDYSVYYRVVGNSNINDVAAQSVNASIAKAAGRVTTLPTAKSLTYNASAQALINAGSGTGTMLYKEGSNEWGVSIPSATTAGTYTVYYKASATTNYSESTSGSVSVNMAKVTPTVTAPTAKSLTYNGSAQELVSGGSTNWGTLKYSTDGASYSTSVSTGVNAGTYTVYYKVDGDANINSVTAKTVSVTIAKAAGSVSTAPTAKGLIYNGSSQALVNAGAGTGTMMYKVGSGSWETSMPTGSNAGDYTVYYKASASTNYNESASGSVSVNMAKVTPTVTAPTAKSLTYNGSAQELVSGGSTNYGTLKYSLNDSTYSTSIPSGTNAGDYSVYYRVDGDSNVNDVAPQSIDVSISKAAGSVTTKPTAKTLTYNGSAQALVNAGSGTGTMLYKVGSDSWGTTIPSGTNSSSYTVYYKASATTNYNESASGSVAVTINKVTPTVTAPVPKSLTYNGSAQALVNGGSTNWGTLKYSSDGSTYNTSIPSGTNASDYSVYYKVDGDSNINDVAAQSLSVNIAKAAGSVSTAPTANTLTYNGSSQTLVTAGSGTGTMMYKLGTGSWDTTIPSGTNASSYTVYYKASASTNYNESASGSVSCSIAKVTPTVTAPTAKSLTYNGSPQALANAGSTNWGTLQYSKDNNIWSISMPTEINAGNYMVYYKVDGDSNINSVAAKSISTPISRASRFISFTTAPTSVVVGSSVTVLAEVSAGSGDGTITYSSSNSSIASVNGNVVTGNDNGTCNITASVSQGTNYISASTSYTLTVEGYTYVDLGLPSGTRWAKCDMGSSSQEGVGEYFSWGNISGHTREEGYMFSVENYASTSGYYVSGDILPVSENDAPRNVWGAPWRLPTKDEVDELLANTDKENITISGRNCWKFINKNDSSKYIIFPKVGYYNGTTLNRDNERVFMWSNNNNSVETPDEAYTLFLGSSSCIAQNINRYIGNTIRPVQDNGGNEEFVFFSDPHVFTEYSEVKWDRDIHLDVMQKYFNLTSSNFIICGGDWLWAHTLQVAIDDLEMANQRMVNMFGNKYYPVLGNHDLNDEGDAEIPASTLTSILFSRWNSHYYTFNGRSTKFYVFDTGSSLNTAMNSYRYEQVKWFCNGLTSNTNSHIVIVMHMAQTGTEDEEPVTCPMAQYLSAAANAFNNRSSYTVDGSSYNFSSCVGRVHIILAGHWHQDNNYVYNNIPIYIIDDARTGNFDVITLDYAENKLKSKRIGTGNDRTITLA